MNRLGKILVATWIAAAVPATASADSVSVLLGARNFDEHNDLKPCDHQDFFAVQYGLDSVKLPVRVFFTLQDSSEEQAYFNTVGTKFRRKVSASQFDIGMIKVFEHYTYLRPYVGAGFSIVNLESRVTNTSTGVTTSADDFGPGVFFNTGVYVRLGERLQVGGDLRILRLADVTLGPLSTSANSVQFGLLVGWRFGSAKTTPAAAADKPAADTAGDDPGDKPQEQPDADQKPEPDSDDDSTG